MASIVVVVAAAVTDKAAAVERSYGNVNEDDDDDDDPSPCQECFPYDSQFHHLLLLLFKQIFQSATITASS